MGLRWRLIFEVVWLGVFQGVGRRELGAGSELALGDWGFPPSMT